MIRGIITGAALTGAVLILFHLYAPKAAYWIFTRGDRA